MPFSLEINIGQTLKHRAILNRYRVRVMLNKVQAEAVEPASGAEIASVLIRRNRDAKVADLPILLLLCPKRNQSAVPWILSSFPGGLRSIAAWGDAGPYAYHTTGYNIPTRKPARVGGYPAAARKDG